MNVKHRRPKASAAAIRRRKVTLQYIALRAAIERFAEKRTAEGKV